LIRTRFEPEVGMSKDGPVKHFLIARRRHLRAGSL
jgi:hypothetical protein